MKIENFSDFKKSGYYKILKEHLEYWYEDEDEPSFENIINTIVCDGSTRRDIKNGQYILTTYIDVNGILFSVAGNQSIHHLGDRGDELGRLILDNFLSITMTPERAKVEEEIKKLRVKEEIERIMEVIQIDKEDGFASRREHNLEKEVILELKTKGLTVKTELWQDSRTGKNDHIAIISW